MGDLNENIEAKVFDDAVDKEFDDDNPQELILTNQILINHLRLLRPPVMAYRYAIYLFKDHEIMDQDVLNIAAGTGYESVILAKKGARVYAFDISQKSVQIAERRAILNEVQDRIKNEVMSVYEMKYPDGRFQFIYGGACLQHFELEKALKEVSRVLKPGGKAVFLEPLGASRFLQNVRNIVPIKKDKVSIKETS